MDETSYGDGSGYDWGYNPSQNSWGTGEQFDWSPDAGRNSWSAPQDAATDLGSYEFFNNGPQFNDPGVTPQFTPDQNYNAYAGADGSGWRDLTGIQETPVNLPAGQPGPLPGSTPPINGNSSTGSAGAVMSFLQSLFSGKGQGNPAQPSAGTNMGNTFKTGLAALMEGGQNQQKAQMYADIAKNPALDPFGTQRGFYQKQAQDAVTNPYDSPTVKAQVALMQRAQDIKNAKAGRRSNDATTNPALMAAMADAAMKYQNQMATLGGAGMRPDGTAISTLLTGSANADINGYQSPIINAIDKTNILGNAGNSLEKLFA